MPPTKKHTIISDEPPKDDLSTLIEKLNNNLQRTTEFNAEFHQMMAKVDAIDVSQHRLITQMEKLNDAIYDPSEGLFARIKTTELARTEADAEIEKNLVVLDTWKQQTEKVQQKDEALTEKSRTSIDDLEKNVVELVKWKKLITSVAQWTIITLAGGGVGIVGKILYNVIVK
jgi:hypothetical protein